MTVKSENIILWYGEGFQDNYHDRRFKDWFPTEVEKYAYLLGWGNFDRMYDWEEAEILEAVKAGFGNVRNFTYI